MLRMLITRRLNNAARVSGQKLFDIMENVKKLAEVIVQLSERCSELEYFESQVKIREHYIDELENKIRESKSEYERVRVENAELRQELANARGN